MTARLAAGVVTLAVAATAAAQSPVFRARVDGVRIDVLATEDGRPVPALSASDFDVRDNGVRQHVDIVSLSDVGISVVLALDLSASVTGQKLQYLRRAGHALIGALTPRDSAALLTFDHRVTMRVPPTSRLSDVTAALDVAPSTGYTALVDAAQAALLVGARDAERTLVVLFSDGVDTASYTGPAMALGTATRVNSVVYAVSTGADATPFLDDLTGATGGRVVRVDEGADPGPAFLEVLREFRRRYVITFTPTGVPGGGWHRLEVRVARAGVRVRARPGYYASGQ